MATIRAREYGNTEAEFQEICDFPDAVTAQDPHIHWMSGTMRDWRNDLHCHRDSSDGFFRANAHVWRED